MYLIDKAKSLCVAFLSCYAQCSTFFSTGRSCSKLECGNLTP